MQEEMERERGSRNDLTSGGFNFFRPPTEPVSPSYHDKSGTMMIEELTPPMKPPIPVDPASHGSPSSKHIASKYTCRHINGISLARP